MSDNAPIMFTDEQLVEAVKAGPEELRNAVAIIAMQIELSARRAADEDPE